MEQPFLPARQAPSHSLPQHATALLRQARDVVDGISSADDAWRGVRPFTLVRRGDRNTVLRTRVPEGDGTPLVFKLLGGDAELADADLRYMSALTGRGVVPDVVADLGDARGFAMVDAGDETLSRVLEQRSAREAQAAIVQMAQVYARLHVEGRAMVARTQAMRDGVLTRELGTWTDGLARALEWLQLSDEDVRVRRALTRIVNAWYADREALTLTHGDPAPSNVLFLPESGEARLVDFEYGAARHPAHDIAAWDVLCPLPNDLVQLLRDEYAAARSALGWPMTPYDHRYASVVAYRALALLAWLPREARDQDRPWVDAWSARQAVLSTLDRLVLRCAGDSELQRLAEAASEAAIRWRKEWPEIEEVLPPWPALRGNTA